MKNIVLSICVIILICSCAEGRLVFLGFEKPQPNIEDSLLVFDEDLHGNYVCEDTNNIYAGFDRIIPINDNDSNMHSIVNSVLMFSDKKIINKVTGQSKLLKTKLDSTEKINLLFKNEIDSLIIKSIQNPKYSYKIDTTGNYFTITFNISSELANLSKRNVLKKYNGNYYLNVFSKFDTGKDSTFYWRCFQLELNKKKKILSINSIDGDDEGIIKRLYEIELGIDSTRSNYLNPSLETFKKFLDMKGFHKKLKFKKL